MLYYMARGTFLQATQVLEMCHGCSSMKLKCAKE